MTDRDIVLVITGGRDRDDQDTRDTLTRLISVSNYLLVGDCPTGVDSIALEIAKTLNISGGMFKANWNKYGKSAGPRRNVHMAEAAIRLQHEGKFVIGHAFPGGPGTRNCIKEMRSRGIEVRVHD